MRTSITQSDLLTDLRHRIEQHCTLVATTFQPLDHQIIVWKSKPTEWNIGQCFDHLSLTHDYYRRKLAPALAHPQQSRPAADYYHASFWAGIYMYFAFNPRHSFPTAEMITPRQVVQETVFTQYLVKQDILVKLLDQLNMIDLCRTRVQIEKGVRFNLGDCLKILVYHDALHIHQAQRVLNKYHHGYPTTRPPVVC